MSVTRQQKRELERLKIRLEEARKRGDYVKQVELSHRIDEIGNEGENAERATLAEALKDYSAEKRREMTVKVITAVGITDILLSAVLDIETEFRQLGVIEVPMLREIKEISHRCRGIIDTINSVHNNFFNEHYCEVTDAVEEKAVPKLKEFIVGEIEKAQRITEKQQENCK